MTRRELRVIAALSVVATVVVLGDGTRGSRSDAALKLAARHGVVVHAALPAAAPAAPAAAPVSAPSPAPADPAPAPQPAAPAAAAAPKAPAPKPKTKAPAAPKPSKVGHVFVIALTGAGYQQTFGAGSAAQYLTTDLAPRGTVLSGFHPVDGADLPNYIAMTGGQPPNPATQAECATFGDFADDVTTSKAGVVAGGGCLYPNTVLSLADQLTSSRRSWRAYAEDMGATTCRHPQPGEADDTLHARPGDQYATRHNPFVYFHSLLDLGDCMANDVTLDKLPDDLKSVSTTPNYAFIAPNLCDSGTEPPCVDGAPGGLAAADAFLKQWVPQILDSPAYKKDGVLVVTFVSGGGVAPTGALLMSRYASAGRTIATAYDPYSLLRSVEDLFALAPLAKAKGADSFAQPALPGAF